VPFPFCWRTSPGRLRPLCAKARPAKRSASQSPRRASGFMRDCFPLKKAHYGFACRPNTSCATNTVRVMEESRAPASCPRTRDTIFKFPHGVSEPRRMGSLNPNPFVYSEAAILPWATSAGLNESSCPLPEPRCLEPWR
jgi:hypothetical protein